VEDLTPDQLHLWSDASAVRPEASIDKFVLPMKGGYAVVYWSKADDGSERWRVCCWPINKTWSSNHSELVGTVETANFVKALSTKSSRWRKVKRPSIVMTMDSQNVHQKLHRGQDLEDLCGQTVLMQPGITEFIRITHELRELGRDLTLRWIPGHDHTVHPHNLADEYAFGVARGEKTPRCDDISMDLDDGEVYESIGDKILSQMEIIAKRHPHLDDTGSTRVHLPNSAEYRQGVVPSNCSPTTTPSQPPSRPLQPPSHPPQPHPLPPRPPSCLLRQPTLPPRPLSYPSQPPSRPPQPLFCPLQPPTLLPRPPSRPSQPPSYPLPPHSCRPPTLPPWPPPRSYLPPLPQPARLLPPPQAYPPIPPPVYAASWSPIYYPPPIHPPTHHRLQRTRNGNEVRTSRKLAVNLYTQNCQNLRGLPIVTRPKGYDVITNRAFARPKSKTDSQQ